MPTFKIVYFNLKDWFLEKCLEVFDRNTMTFELIDEYLAKFQTSEVQDCKYASFILIGLQNNAFLLKK